MYVTTKQASCSLHSLASIYVAPWLPSKRLTLEVIQSLFTEFFVTRVEFIEKNDREVATSNSNNKLVNTCAWV